MRRLLLTGLLFATASTAVAGPVESPIIGGTATKVGDYPTVVALTIGQGMCTGTLITPEWILTAAHCITPALVGEADQEAVTESTTVHFNTINLNQSFGTMIQATATIPKPGFSVNRLGQHDIGLIKLARPYTDVAPTPVNLDAAKAPVGISGSMVGFGDNKAGSVGVEYALLNRTSTGCAKFGGSDANLLCFAQDDAKGKCRGDSGGPTFAVVDGKPTVVGVTSFGDRDCAVFGMDTRTDAERAFLLEHVPELQCTIDDDCSGEQLCFQGRCIAQPFSDTGLGASCTGATDCDSAQCATAGDDSYCTMACAPGAENACPAGLACVAADGAAGVCWPEDTGGCCSGSGGAPTALFAMGLVGFGLVFRRRR